MKKTEKYIAGIALEELRGLVRDETVGERDYSEFLQQLRVLKAFKTEEKKKKESK